MRLLALSLTLFLTLFISACGSDDTASASCTVDDDCALGTVCGAGKTCIEAACQFCTGDQICYRTEENPQGTCSKPECTDDSQCETGICRDFVCASEECMSDDDCPAGQSCSIAFTCEISSCETSDDCGPGTFCGASGSCEEGCAENGDCDTGEQCDTTTNSCVAGCMSDEDCSGSETCSDGACVCTVGGCPSGSYCDTATGSCAAVTDCSQVTCPDGEACNPDNNFECETSCTPGSCAAEDPNTVCDVATGQCVANSCPGQDPNQCDTTSRRDTWDPARCFCAECLSDNDCNTAAGETCTAGGICFACETACDPQSPGVCQNSQYCIDDCCVDCVGTADCAAGELCIDGSCAPEPDCSQDPSVCPQGYTCEAGSCQPPDTSGPGGICDPTDPTSCPQGTFCDPMSLMCGLPGGANFCGLCNTDCTCDNGLNCNGFLCDGCTPFAGDCPDTPDGDSQNCIIGLNICFPLPF